MNEQINQQNLSEAEIDNLVIQQADDDSAWETPIQVHKTSQTSLCLPPDLVARAAFLAKLHRETTPETWLTRIIRERIELEEAAFLQVKGELTKKVG